MKFNNFFCVLVFILVNLFCTDHSIAYSEPVKGKNFSSAGYENNQYRKINKEKRETQFLKKHWYKSSFPTVLDSVKYHLKKHGKGRSALQYTKEGIAFYQQYKHKKRKATLSDGTPGYKIEIGRRGGYWTREGKLVTFWG